MKEDYIMTRSKSPGKILQLFVLIFLSTAPHALAGTLTVTINGQQVGPCNWEAEAAGCSVNIAGLYGQSVTISNLGTGTARVEVQSDTTGDTVKLLDAKLSTGGTAIDNYNITFEATGLQDPPTTTAGDPKYYFADGTGQFLAPLRQGDFIKLTGWYRQADHYPTYPDGIIANQVTKTVSCTYNASVCGKFNPSNGFRVWNGYAPIAAGNRDLKGEILIKMRQSTSLNLNQIALYKGDPPGDEPGPERPSPQPAPQPSERELEGILDCTKCVIHGDVIIHIH